MKGHGIAQRVVASAMLCLTISEEESAARTFLVSGARSFFM